MKTTVLGLALALAAFAGLPGDVPVDLLRMKPLESACVFPVHFTVESNIWISPESVYRRTDGEPCILTLTRTQHGWSISTHGIPIRMQKTRDSELRRFGWINLGPFVGVLQK